ncbi:hypothetical protein GCM10020220_086030 [Nonomuraea rubra]|uniref:hypothetical protein n=1 Tax=Nonomuraea rubra TaxID=46180 RepID=UPI0031E515C2
MLAPDRHSRLLADAAAADHDQRADQRARRQGEHDRELDRVGVEVDDEHDVDEDRGRQDEADQHVEAGEQGKGQHCSERCRHGGGLPGKGFSRGLTLAET